MTITIILQLQPQEATSAAAKIHVEHATTTMTNIITDPTISYKISYDDTSKISSNYITTVINMTSLSLLSTTTTTTVLSTLASSLSTKKTTSVTESSDQALDQPIPIPIPSRYRESLINYVAFSYHVQQAETYGVTECPAGSSSPVSNLEFANWLEDNSYAHNAITRIFRNWPDYADIVYQLNRDLLEQVMLRSPYDWLLPVYRNNSKFLMKWLLTRTRSGRGNGVVVYKLSTVYIVNEPILLDDKQQSIRHLRPETILRNAANLLFENTCRVKDKLHGKRYIFNKYGQMLLEETYVNNNKTGPYMHSNPDTGVTEIGHLLRGKLDGEIKHYETSDNSRLASGTQIDLQPEVGLQPQLQLVTSTTYVAGRKAGPYISYYSTSGRVRVSCNQYHNRVEGDYYCYYDNANNTLMTYGQYNNGKHHGVEEMYTEDGKIVSQHYYDHGTLSSTPVYPEISIAIHATANTAYSN